MLVLLDNLEQIVAAAPAIASILAVSPGLKVLTTSRTPLHLSAEHTYDVPPLAVPDLRQLPDLGTFSTSSRRSRCSLSGRGLLGPDSRSR